LVVGELEDYKGRIIDIRLVPNRGRDIGPFLKEFGGKIMANYDFIGHFHTKKSVHVENSIGRSWYLFLLENLLGDGSEAMADRILSKMKNDTSIGMVFPDDPNVIGWGPIGGDVERKTNLAFAQPIAAHIGLQRLPESFIFPVGTMFWARTSTLTPFVNLNLDWNDYPEEPLPIDGTLLHALERLFPLVLPLNNLHCATTNVIGLTR